MATFNEVLSRLTGVSPLEEAPKALFKVMSVKELLEGYIATLMKAFVVALPENLRQDVKQHSSVSPGFQMEVSGKGTTTSGESLNWSVEVSLMTIKKDQPQVYWMTLHQSDSMKERDLKSFSTLFADDPKQTIAEIIKRFGQ